MPSTISPGVRLAQYRKWRVPISDESLRLKFRDPDGNSVTWQTHNRNHIGSWYSDTRGVVIHHTAGNTTPTWLIRDGRSDVPGPLAENHVMRDGSDDGLLHLTGHKRTNHAGRGCRKVFDAMSRGRDIPSRPGPDEVDYNAYTHSFEVNGTNDGKAWTHKQIDTVVRACAALADYYGWNENHFITHSELTRRKPLDPSGITADLLRQLIRTRLLMGPGDTPKPPPPPKPEDKPKPPPPPPVPTDEENFMAYDPDLLAAKIGAAVVRALLAAPAGAGGGSTNVGQTLYRLQSEAMRDVELGFVNAELTELLIRSQEVNRDDEAAVAAIRSEREALVVRLGELRVPRPEGFFKDGGDAVPARRSLVDPGNLGEEN